MHYAFTFALDPERVVADRLLMSDVPLPTALTYDPELYHPLDTQIDAVGAQWKNQDQTVWPYHKVVRTISEQQKSLYVHYTWKKLNEIMLERSVLLPGLGEATSFRVLAIGDAPGSWSHFLLERSSATQVLGISLLTPGNIQWNERLIKVRNFSYLKENDGDLTQMLEKMDSSLETALKMKVNNGIDLVTADGGISVLGNEAAQEELHLPLMIAEVYAAVVALRPGGCMILKVYETTSPFWVRLLWAIATLFESLTITKGYMVSPLNRERYLVATGLRNGVDKLHAQHNLRRLYNTVVGKKSYGSAPH